MENSAALLPCMNVCVSVHEIPYSSYHSIVIHKGQLSESKSCFAANMKRLKRLHEKGDSNTRLVMGAMRGHV